MLLTILLASFFPVVLGFDAFCFHNTLDVSLPVRYIFIQITDDFGRNLATNAEIEQKLEVFVDSDDKCRFQHELLNNFDGTFLFRFRIFVACSKIKIVFKLENKPICQSPFILDKPEKLQPEECACGKPDKTVQEWFETFCPRDERYYQQLNKDFQRFPVIDFQKTLEKVEKKWGHPDESKSAALCRYRIHNNQVFKHCYGEYTGFSMFSDNFLLSMSRKMRLPNVEFFQNLGDWPLEREDPRTGFAATIISWCGSNTTSDIILPTYEVTDAVLKSMHQVLVDIQNVPSLLDVPWEKKLEKAVFRGRDSNELRIAAVKLAKDRRDLIDAGITRYFFFLDPDNPPTVPQTSFADFFKYKYVLNIDGTVAAYRFPFLLAGNSLVVKQESPYFEHFYASVKPGIHYIPFDPQNLLKTLEDLKNGDQNWLKKIAQNGKRFIRDQLQPLNVYCFHAKFFIEYSARFQPATNFSSSAEKVETKNKKFCRCETAQQKSEL